MKVTKVIPGNVRQTTRGTWRFNFYLENNEQAREIRPMEDFISASEAKQRMREEVYFQRRKHLTN